jgi:hypothetical protein
VVARRLGRPDGGSLSRLALASLIAAALGLGGRTDTCAAPRIENLEVRHAAAAIEVGFAVADALGPETVERLHSGMPLTFRHRAEIIVRRSVPLWPARILAALVVESTVRFDALTRQYTLERRVRTRQRNEPPRETEVRDRTAEFDAAALWLTTVAPTELFRGAIEPGARLRLRVTSDLERRYVLLLIPSRMSVAAERELGP